MTRKERAMEQFHKGYNCAQSLVLAYADLFPMEEKQLAALVSPFGGGMGRLREVCGAVSGMCFVLGQLYGYEDPAAEDHEEKKAAVYGKVQTVADAFAQKYGTILCRELLELDVKRQDPTPEKRTEAYYAARPCEKIVGDAAEILEEFLKNAEKEK